MPGVEDWSRNRTFLRGGILLLLLERPGHGYDLIERLRTLGLHGTERSVYRVLDRLEDEGCIRST